jgi:hypothetical protein
MKKNSKLTTLSREARIEGPRPIRVATKATPSRYTIARLRGSKWWKRRPETTLARPTTRTAMT